MLDLLFYTELYDSCWEKYMRTGHWAIDTDAWVMDQYDGFFHKYYMQNSMSGLGFDFREDYFLEEFMDFLDESRVAIK